MTHVEIEDYFKNTVDKTIKRNICRSNLMEADFKFETSLQAVVAKL